MILLALPLAVDARVDEMLNDMRLPHVAIPRGLPTSVDWRPKPRPGMMNDPGEFRALIAWGQVYAAEGTKNPPNTRVQVRGIQTWLLRKSTGKWERVQYTSEVGGAFYREDFADDKNIPSDARKEPSGGISVSIVDGHNYHFWPTTGRIAIDPKEIGGWYTTVQARLILADAKKADDRRDAKLMMSMGADYWKALDSQWDYFKTNGDLAVGRFRWITKDWQWYHMVTVPEAELRKNPPPVPRP